MPRAVSGSADRLRRLPLVTAGLIHGSLVIKALEFELTRDVPRLPPATPLPARKVDATEAAVRPPDLCSLCGRPLAEAHRWIS